MVSDINIRNVYLRISRLLANVDIFNNKTEVYECALRTSGYKERIMCMTHSNINSNYIDQNTDTVKNVNIVFH